MAGRQVVVVGAGLGGLAAAIRLAAAGLDVTVCEREDRPGGRVGRRTSEGFVFDTGPTVLTMPSLLDELFALAGERVANRLDLVRLDPAYRAVFHDGSQLLVRDSVEATAAEVAALCGPAEADRFRRFAEHLARLYDTEYRAFIDRNFDSPLDLVAAPGAARALATLVRLGGFRRLYALVAAHLKDWRLRRLFTFQAMYAGMSPFQALGIYAVIAYMDTVAGVFYPRGGIHRVAEELAGLATRLGADLRFAEPVESVEVAAGSAVAVRTAGGQRLRSDVAVLNADLPVAYRDLLPVEAAPRRLRRLRYSPSCLVVHLGLDRPLTGAAHHNIHFAAGYRESFDDLLAGHLQRDPSWFLSVPTVTDPGLAPSGGATAFYLLPTPNLEGGPVNWDAQGPRELVLAQRRLSEAGYGPVADATVVREAVTPADWARAGMAAGTPFSSAHHFTQTGPFRPPNVASRVRGVVFAGSGTTPGVGIPMVLVSGKLAAERTMGMLGGSALRRGAGAMHRGAQR